MITKSPPVALAQASTLVLGATPMALDQGEGRRGMANGEKHWNWPQVMVFVAMVAMTVVVVTALLVVGRG